MLGRPPSDARVVKRDQKTAAVDKIDHIEIERCFRSASICFKHLWLVSGGCSRPSWTQSWSNQKGAGASVVDMPLTEWVSTLKRDELYSNLIGCSSGSSPPLGFYYDFINRLWAAPSPTATNVIRPSLPTRISLNPKSQNVIFSARRHDSVVFLLSYKEFQDPSLPVSVRDMGLDSAHDNYSTYELLLHDGIRPFVDPNRNRGVLPPFRRNLRSLLTAPLSARPYTVWLSGAIV